MNVWTDHQPKRIPVYIGQLEIYTFEQCRDLIRVLEAACLNTEMWQDAECGHKTHDRECPLCIKRNTAEVVCESVE